MNNRYLINILKAHGIIHQEQFGFRGMVSGIANDARIVCAEIEMKKGFSGISFWLYGEEQDWFIGLWSGVYFKITRLDSVEDMIVELYSGKQLPRGKVPPVLPDAFVERYGLILCHPDQDMPKA